MGQTNNNQEEKMTISNEAERKVIFLMRNLTNQYESIEIKLNDKREFSIVSKSTLKEIFPNN